MKKVLITGANGYIGSHLTSLLCEHEEDYQVVATDIGSHNIDKRAEFVKYNFLNGENNADLFSFFGKPDVCVHFAWRDGFDHNSLVHIQDFPAHFLFLKNLIDHGLSHLAVAGSFREYGNHEGMADENLRFTPENFYTLTKTALKDALEIYLKDKRVCFQWIRPFTVYGDDSLNSSLMSKILLWEKEGKTSFPFTEGNEEYDYILVSDLAKQIAAILSQTKIDGVIDCCSGKPTKLKDKIEEFILENNLKIRPEYGAFKTRPYDSKVIYGDSTKIKKILANDSRFHSRPKLEWPEEMR